MTLGKRAALILPALALAAAGLAQLRSFGDEQQSLDDLARKTGVLSYEPGLLDVLAREPDPWHARLRLAGVLLASTAVPSVTSAAVLEGSPSTAIRRLEMAHDLAAEVAVERPASWEASMIQGASAYLGWSLLRDRQLLTRPDEWETPLLRSLELAPGRPEPVRFLSAAYLELWPALSRGKQEKARRLLARALTERRTFEALIEPWMKVAGSQAEAFSVIPSPPWAWERLQQIEAREAEWNGYREARLRWYAALERTARGNLAEAQARLRGGDSSGAQLLFLGLLQTPPRRRFLPMVESALAQCPPGAAGGSAGPAIQAWLDWSLDLCLWKTCPVPESSLRRLTELAGDPPPVLAARAAILSGDLPSAEAQARRAEEPWSQPWGPFWIALAKALADRRELEGASAALDFVHLSWRATSPYWAARLAVAQAGGDGVREAEALHRIEELQRTEWPVLQWSLDGPSARLEIVPAVPAPGFTLEILAVPDRGAGVEVRVDGEVVAVSGAFQGGVLTVRHALDTGPHLLEAEAVSGGRLVPGAVRLLK